MPTATTTAKPPEPRPHQRKGPTPSLRLRTCFDGTERLRVPSCRPRKRGRSTDGILKQVLRMLAAERSRLRLRPDGAGSRAAPRQIGPWPHIWAGLAPLISSPPLLTLTHVNASKHGERRVCEKQCAVGCNLRIPIGVVCAATRCIARGARVRCCDGRHVGNNMGSHQVQYADGRGVDCQRWEMGSG